MHLTESLPDKQISKPGTKLGTDSFSDDGDEIDLQSYKNHLCIN